MAKETNIVVLAILCALVGLGFGTMWSPLSKVQVVDKPVPVEVPVYVPVVNSTETVVTDDVWKTRAFDQVVDELGDDDSFYTCGSHEYNEDEMSYDIRDYSVVYHRNGDITVDLSKVKFTFDDDSDERSCKVDRAFSVFWDKDDISDEDWNKAKVKWDARASETN